MSERFPKEQEYWHQIISDLQAKFGAMSRVAEAVYATEQSMWQWKKGRTRPTGVVAVRLYLLHVKLYSGVSSTPYHIDWRGERVV